MPHSRFLYNTDYWSELRTRAARAKGTRAAVAYVGTGGASLLPLKRGDELIVDLSLRTVRQGATDPNEIRKLIRRGVLVWTRPSLHAKVFITDSVVIAGSANLSTNASTRLDEAAVLSSDPEAVRRALAFHARMRTEPVRPEYLKKCIQEYRPPRFVPGAASRERDPRAARAKLWYLGRVVPLELSEIDARLSDRADVRARKKFSVPKATELSWVRFRKPPAFWSNIQAGDWVFFRTVEKGQAPYVEAPCQVLGFDILRSARGTEFHRVLLEAPMRSEPLPWSVFRRRVARHAEQFAGARPRAGPISDDQVADKVLSLWTGAGRVARRRT